jgi:glycopeptide antibiotics resistance protein
MRLSTIIPLGVAAFFAAGVLLLVQWNTNSFRVTRPLYVFAARFLGLWYAFVAACLLFKLETIGFAARGLTNPFAGNYVPFETITLYVAARDAVQLLGNAGVFFPLPILLYLNFPKTRYRRLLCVTLIASAAVEPVQILVNVVANANVNIIDVDDLILNVAGAVLGCVALFVIMKLRELYRRGHNER